MKAMSQLLASVSARLCLLTILGLAMSGGTALAEAPVNAEGMVAAHNAVRAQVGQSDLAWSQEMVEVAAGWARQLEANPRWCQAVIHNHERPDRTGENMHAATVNSPSDEIPPNDIVGAWAAEGQHYDHESGACAPGQVCGHYVQVVWGETTELGCSAAVCQDQNGELLRVTICNYRPGLLIGQKPF